MSRRNELDTDRQQRGFTAEQVIWSVVRTKKTFTIHEVWYEDGVEVAKRDIIQYLKLLELNKYIKRTADFETTGVYKLIRGGRKTPPKLGHPAHSNDRHRALQNMWNTMRRMDSFSAKDVCVMSNTPDVEISETAASNYCSLLAQAGYLRVVQRGSRKSLARYQLVDNTGPNPPIIRRETKIYDGNEQRMRYLEGS